MIKIYNKYRYLILRRTIQVSILLLFIGGNIWGFNFVKGNLSSSLWFDFVPLSDPYALLQMLLAGGIIGIDAIVGALIILLFYMVFGGRIFCSFVCPMNMVTDLAFVIRQKLAIDKIQKKSSISRNTKYLILLLSLIVSIVSGVAAFEFISPISILHRSIIFGTGFSIAIVLVILLFDIFILKNGWCGHICPLGGFYSIVGKFSFLKVKHSSENCTKCMKCKEVCPEVQILDMIGKQSIVIDSIACTKCSRCIEVCDDNALSFLNIKKD